MPVVTRAGASSPGILDANRPRILAIMGWIMVTGETEITYVIVPTPSGADGAFKNDPVPAAIEEIGRVLAHKRGCHLVVINSTTMPGSVGGPIRDRLEVYRTSVSATRSVYATLQSLLHSATSSKDCCGPISC
jgi:hypothetical protein